MGLSFRGLSFLDTPPFSPDFLSTRPIQHAPAGRGGGGAGVGRGGGGQDPLSSNPLLPPMNWGGGGKIYAGPPV